ncbi:MAG: peroxiredoxin [Myxococcota bacterium]
MTDLQLNAPAPTFTLSDHERNKVSLSDFKGKKVVLAFFPAAFTGVCEKEMCTFRDALADLNTLNAEVLAISTDGPFANAAFAAKNNLNFPVLSDVTAQISRDYGVALDDFAGVEGYTVSQRAVFVVDADGNLSWSWVAPNPGVEPDYDAVKAAL